MINEIKFALFVIAFSSLQTVLAMPMESDIAVEATNLVVNSTSTRLIHINQGPNMAWISPCCSVQLASLPNDCTGDGPCITYQANFYACNEGCEIARFEHPAPSRYAYASNKAQALAGLQVCSTQNPCNPIPTIGRSVTNSWSISVNLQGDSNSNPFKALTPSSSVGVAFTYGVDTTTAYEQASGWQGITYNYIPAFAPLYEAVDGTAIAYSVYKT
ncbi:hypothetical protein HDU76_005598 [Blyttiomyces sp. JEL0837]|nr:hypothetical protein HDU76_005598 [Blyttiomyces sp. JEL0837]